MWEVFFWVDLLAWVVIVSLNTLAVRRIWRKYQEMNARWREVVSQQRETILELRRQIQRSE